MDLDQVPFNEQEFAVLVKARPILWDHTHRNHWKKSERQIHWNDLAAYFAEVDGASLEAEFKRIRKSRNQRKMRLKKATKSGSAGGQQIENIAADRWAFLDDVGLDTANVSRMSNISGDDREPEHGDGDAQEDLLQLALAGPRHSIAFRDDPMVGDCCAAVNDANERINEERGLRLPNNPSPSRSEPEPSGQTRPMIPGEFVLSPHGRQMRMRTQDGGNDNGRADEAAPSTPSGRRPARNRRPPSRYSPSDHESDNDSTSSLLSSSITASARRRRRRGQIHQPVNLSIIEEDVGIDGVVDGILDGDHVDGDNREGITEQPIANRQQSVPVANPQVEEGEGTPPRDQRRPHVGAAGDGLNVGSGENPPTRDQRRPHFGGAGDGLHVGGNENPPHRQHPAVTAAQQRRQQREGQNARVDRVAAAGQRVQAAFEERRQAQRNVIRAQVEAQAVRRQRRGNNDDDPDDPRRMEEGPDMVLLRQFLAEKDMDAFGHFGQTVACLLRSLPPRRSGEAMVDILQTLHTYSLAE